jgi:hypothetical protein
MENKIKDDMKTLEELKDVIKAQPINNNNNNNTNTQNNNNFNTSLTMNVLTKEYIINFLTNAPCVKELDNYDDVRIDNIITDPYYEDENIMFVNTVHNQYMGGKLIQYIGNVIISFYKKEDKIGEQSFWCSDLSRLKFLVRILPKDSTCNMWVIDSSGIIIKDRVVKPLLNYIIKCIDQYRIKYMTDDDIDFDKYLELSDIIMGISNDHITDKVARYIAPHFTIGRKLIADKK